MSKIKLKLCKSQVKFINIESPKSKVAFGKSKVESQVCKSRVWKCPSRPPYSRPDHEVSKPSSDSHRSLTDLEHTAVNGDSPSILASSWDPPPGWLCPSEFELAMAADRDKHPELLQGVTVVVYRHLCSCLRLSELQLHHFSRLSPW